MKIILSFAIAAAMIAPAYAAGPTSPALQQQQMAPVIQALGLMVQEAQSREAQALVRAITAEQSAAAEKARADAAEAKLPKPDAKAP